MLPELADIYAPAEKLSDHELQITDAKLMGSYDWVDKPRIAIRSPGMPPRWTPRTDCPLLSSDHRKFFYRDINAAYCESGALVPAVKSLMWSKSSLGSLDILADARSLGSLLDFARGKIVDSCRDKTVDSWRIVVANVAGVVHMAHRQRDGPKERIKDVHGFGHAFVDSYTRWEMSGSFSHQRMTKYRFGGLKLLVRYSSDAYLPESLEKEDLKSQITAEPIDELADSLAETKIQGEKSNGPLRVIPGGVVIPQSALCDIKTRSHNRKAKEVKLIADILPRLWIRQIPHLLLAYHEASEEVATFSDIKTIEAEEPLKSWTRDENPGIRKFAGLLHTIVKVAQRRGEGQFEIVFDEGSPDLQFCEPSSNAPQLLPLSVREDWTDFLAEALKDEGCEGTAGAEEASQADPDFTACDAECNYCGRCK